MYVPAFFRKCWDLMATERGAPDPVLTTMQALGSVIVAESFDLYKASQTQNLVSGMYLQAIYLSKRQTLTGVKWWQTIQGVYTANNNNRIGLFSYSNGTLTLVASCANIAALWQGVASVFQTQAFSSTYAAAPGLYFIGMLYNASATTTFPAVAAMNSTVFAGGGAFEYTNSAKSMGTVAGLTDLPATQAMSGVSVTGIPIWCSLY